MPFTIAAIALNGNITIQTTALIMYGSIGPRTISRAKETGLRGIAVHAGNALIVDEAETLKLAEKEGLFVIGVNPSEYK